MTKFKIGKCFEILNNIKTADHVKHLENFKVISENLLEELR